MRNGGLGQLPSRIIRIEFLMVNILAHAYWLGCWGCGRLLDSDRSEPKGRYGVNLMTIMSMDDFESMMQSGHQMNTIGCSKEDGVWQSRNCFNGLFQNQSIKGKPGPVTADVILRELAYGRCELLRSPLALAQSAVKYTHQFGTGKFGEKNLVFVC